MSRIGQFLPRRLLEWRVFRTPHICMRQKKQYPVNAPKHGYGYFFSDEPDDLTYRGADGYVWSVHRGGAQEQSGDHGAGAGQ